MQDLTVLCSECGAEIAVTESLAAPLLEATKKEFEKRLADKNKELRNQASEMEKRRADLLDAEAALDETIQQKVKVLTGNLAAEAEKKARTTVEEEMKSKNEALRDAEALLKSRNNALKEVSEAAASLRKEKAALEEEALRLATATDDKVTEELRKAKIKYQIEHENNLARELAAKDEELAQAKREAELSSREEIRRNQEEAEKKIANHDRDLIDARRELNERDEELALAKATEAEFLKAKRGLDAERRQMAVTIQEKVEEELLLSRASLQTEMDRDYRRKIGEKDVLLESMKLEIENLKRKSEQGSQQIQGEVWERELVDTLNAKFPFDTIKRIGKGQLGADCLQEVYNNQGKLCGTILWEAKKAKNWNNDWVQKLRDNQRSSKADTAIIVSHVLPGNLTTFEQREDIWITGPDCLVSVAGALRHVLIEISATKRANEGHQDKAALIYNYVTSQAFRQRVTALAETYESMQSDLRAEQKVIKKQWARREMQLERMIDATTGMFGDLQGIAGKSLPEIDGLSFAALESEN